MMNSAIAAAACASPIPIQVRISSTTALSQDPEPSRVCINSTLGIGAAPSIRQDRAVQAETRGNTDQAPSRSARDRMVLENLPLVKAIAAQVCRSLPVHADFDDLVQAGTVGLVDAAN